MSDDIDDIQDPRYHMSRRTFFLTCTWVCFGMVGSTCSECLPVVTCDFEPPEHVPRISARAHICAVVLGRAPCVLWSREHQKRPAAGREKMPMCKNTFIHSNTRFPFGMCVTWNPGRGASWWKGTRRQHSSSHSLFYVGGNMAKKTAGQEEFLLTTIIHFEHYFFKKSQLWDRGFRRNSSLQPVWDTSIARTAGFMWPHQEC